jgi:uncharacterized RDD family membrane protein YckC
VLVAAASKFDNEIGELTPKPPNPDPSYAVAGRFDAIDSQFEVVTPENIAFRYQIAGPFRRLPAYLIDLVLRFLIGAALMIAALLLPAVANVAPTGSSMGLMLLGWFLLGHFYGGFFETFWNGQTPGKAACKLRVLTVDGQPINALQAVLRNLLRDVDAMPFVFGYLGQVVGEGFYALAFLGTFWVGLIVMACSERFQRLGDLACGTIVVVESREGQHGVIKFSEPAVLELAERLPADLVVGRSLARGLAIYVGRRRLFTPARRIDIARHVAQPLIRRYSLPLETNYDTLLCAVYERTFGVRRGERSGPPPLVKENELVISA